MAIKISTLGWAIKVNHRSFYKMSSGGPVTLNTKHEAEIYAESITQRTGVKAEPIRVRVRIEEQS